MTATVLVAVIGVMALGVGFLSGLWCYAHVYQHFFARAEETAKRRVAVAVSAERAGKQRVEEVRRRMRAQWGDDLSAKHQEVMDEEIEKVLGAGPR